MSANTYNTTVFDPVSSGTVITVANNAGGEIVGTFINNTNQVTDGFISSGGVVSIVALTGAAQTDITAVNNGGTVIGYTFSTNAGTSNAVGFVASGGTVQHISEFGVDIEPMAINANGEVVGTAGQGSFIDIGNTFVALNVSGAESTTAMAVNASGTVVGNYVDSAGVQHGFETTAAGGTVTIDPSGSVSTVVAGITSGGEIVGSYANSAGDTLGFTDVNGTFTTIQAFQSTDTIVTGVNDAGSLVGFYLTSVGALSGFVDIGGVIDQFAPVSAVSTQPTAINNANQIVGTYDNAAGVEQAFATTATPSYNITSFDPGVVGGVQNVALANGGEIVGTYVDSAGVAHGFTDIGGTIATFNDTSVSSGMTVTDATNITAVNASGTFAGFASAGNASNGQSFVVQGGTVTNEPGNNGLTAQAVAINSSGEVVGNIGTVGFADVATVVTSVSVTGADSTTVTGVNNAGEVVGDYIDSAGVQNGFTELNGVYTKVDPAGAQSTAITGINTAGNLVGTYVTSTGSTVGFTDINGFLQQVSAPGSTFTVLNAINDANTAVGYATVGGVNKAIVDDGGVVSFLTPAGSVNAQADAINNSGEIVGTYADATGVEHAFSATTTPACYCPGTLIRTDRGDVAVETLAIGDVVITTEGRAEAVRWIGRRSYAARFLRGRPALLPVRIKAGALADRVPSQDLLVSPAHAMLLDGVLVPAAELVNGATIVRETGLDLVEYFHIELAKHDLVWANGAASETFVDDDSRAMFSNAAEYAALYGNEPAADAVFCAERVTDGYALDTIRAKLDARAGLLAAA